MVLRSLKGLGHLPLFLNLCARARMVLLHSQLRTVKKEIAALAVRTVVM